MGPAYLGQGRRTPGVPATVLQVLFPGERVAGTEGAREDRSISAGRLPGTAAAGPRGEGRERSGLRCPPS